MTKYKEFQGKTLDDAIREACEYYGVPREKLEIDIVSDAKTGIFGLVGVKKATIRASRVALAETVSSLLEKTAEKETPPAAPATSGAGKGPGKAPTPVSTAPRQKAPSPSVAAPDTPRQKAPSPAAEAPVSPRRQRPPHAAPSAKPGEPEPRLAPKPAASSPAAPTTPPAAAASAAEAPARNVAREPQPAPREQVAAASMDESSAFAFDGVKEDLPEFDLSGADVDSLAREIENVVLRLVEPIVGEVPCRVEIGNDRARVSLDCGDAAGLLVGRDGQTLAAVQYLAARIVGRKIGGALRLHIDAGHYRERQDDRLKELALSLAAKVKKTRKPQSTRPLSAYQRRIVHLALEPDPDVSTRSKGEGAQRRVVVYWAGSGN